MKAGYRLTTDHAEIDHRAIWQWLHDESYWAKGRPWEVHRRSVTAPGVRCFGILTSSGETAAYCRLVTDGVLFAWLADVVVLPGHQRQGLGKDLIRRVVAEQEADGIRRVLLRTADAHGLYEQHGFSAVPDGFMDRTIDR
jgi:GNAT superfamily N-acetyltransferase